MNTQKWRIYVLPASAPRNFYAPHGAFVVRQPGCDTPIGTVCAPKHFACSVWYIHECAVQHVSREIQSRACPRLWNKRKDDDL